MSLTTGRVTCVACNWVAMAATTRMVVDCDLGGVHPRHLDGYGCHNCGSRSFRPAAEGDCPEGANVRLVACDCFVAPWLHDGPALPFEPRNVDGHPMFAKAVLTHVFCSQDAWSGQLDAWLDAVEPGLSFDVLMRTGTGRLKGDGSALRLDAASVEAACTRLFGPPTPMGERTWPRNEWVVSTPHPAVFVTVRLTEDPMDRFGAASEIAMMEGVNPSWNRFEAEAEVLRAAWRDAVRTTIRAIHAALPPVA